MNQHLRFLTVRACPGAKGFGLSAVTALLLGACSSTNEVVSANSEPSPEASRLEAVSLTTYLFTTPEGYMPSRNEGGTPEVLTYSREDGQKMVRRLQRSWRCQQIEHRYQQLSVKSGEAEEFELFREFIYPTEYEPAKVSDPLPSGEVRLIAPVTPTNFQARKVGIKAAYTVEIDPKNVIDLGLSLNHSRFFGIVNYGEPLTTTRKGAFGRPVEVVLSENVIMQPVFGTSRTNTSVMVRPGDYIVVRGLNQESPPVVKDERYSPSPSEKKTLSNSPVVAVIKVGE